MAFLVSRCATRQVSVMVGQGKCRSNLFSYQRLRHAPETSLRLPVYWFCLPSFDLTKEISHRTHDDPLTFRSTPAFRSVHPDRLRARHLSHIRSNRLLHFHGRSPTSVRSLRSSVNWTPTYDDAPMWCLIDHSTKYTRRPASNDAVLQAPVVPIYSGNTHLTQIYSL